MQFTSVYFSTAVTCLYLLLLVTEGVNGCSTYTFSYYVYKALDDGRNVECTIEVKGCVGGCAQTYHHNVRLQDGTNPENDCTYNYHKCAPGATTTTAKVPKNCKECDSNWNNCNTAVTLAAGAWTITVKDTTSCSCELTTTTHPINGKTCPNF